MIVIYIVESAKTLFSFISKCASIGSVEDQRWPDFHSQATLPAHTELVVTLTLLVLFTV